LIYEARLAELEYENDEMIFGLTGESINLVVVVVLPLHEDDHEDVVMFFD
jgi:hypothetical protein